MDKTGELAEGCSRCDLCGNLATVIAGSRAYCASCAPGGEKEATVPESPGLKSFTQPLEGS